ncbi:putative reverse transcriptase domain-containing protein [Tanacetum coccineum]|uniref:Reverse transcriptase domain-containing protein n=1 Tax=Tanacetum coccineum TaxID=301880 RepID=A0ABQ4YAK0_9ASTR
MTRTVRVALDTTQYHMDVSDIAKRVAEDVYHSFNILMRRKSKENNFKAILESIRDLMNEICIVPDWLHDIFLGYANPSERMFFRLSGLFPGNNINKSNLQTQMPFNQEFPLPPYPYAAQNIIGDQISPFSQKRSVNFQLILQFIQGVAFMLAIAGIAIVVALFSLTMTDILASILAFIPTGWGRLLVDDRFCIYLEYVHPGFINKYVRDHCGAKQSDEKRKRSSKTQEEDNVEEAASLISLAQAGQALSSDLINTDNVTTVASSERIEDYRVYAYVTTRVKKAIHSHATVTYTSISSAERSWSILAMDPYEEAALQAPEQAPPSPDYVPGPEYLEYLAPSDDEIPVEDQPLPTDASPIALSPGYVANSDLEEDPKENPADKGYDEEEESFEDDDDEEEEEEHLAPTDSILPAIDSVPSVEETEPFETNESAATPPPPRSPQTIYVAVPTASSPPPSPLSPWSTPLPQIPSPPLPLPSPPLFEVGESSAAAATRQTGLDFTYGTDYGFINTLDASIRDAKEREPTTLEEVDERVTDLATTLRQETEEMYVRQEDAQDDRAFLRAWINMLRRDMQYFISMSFAFKREAMYARKAWSRSEGRSTALEALIRAQEARITALEAQVRTMQTQHDRMEWQRQEAGDMVTLAYGRIHALETRDPAHHNGVEETGSSC